LLWLCANLRFQLVSPAATSCLVVEVVKVRFRSDNPIPSFAPRGERIACLTAFLRLPVFVRVLFRNYDRLMKLVAWPSIMIFLMTPAGCNGADVTATKILWGQIIAVFAIVFAATWLATEWTAWSLGFQAQLGARWFELAGVPVYMPPAFFWWWYRYDAYAPRQFLEGAAIAASGGVASVVVAIGMSIWRAHEARTITTYGSARWATKAEIRTAGLLGPDGIVLGCLGRSYLRHDGPEHVLCFAPTRSGKGVGLVIPTLLTWPGSAIVHDIKGENWQFTAGCRARFGRVLLFDPTNSASAPYNPLLEVRRGDTEVRDVQNVADILVDPEGALERRNHWEKTSHSLLVGAILHVLYAEPDKTLAGVANFLSDPERSIETTLRAMMTTPHLGDRPHPVVASAARELLNKSENERSGVLSTAMSLLGLYRDPVVTKVTSRCDWRIDELVEGKRPVTLYLVVPPSDISRTKPLIRLILNQIGRRLTEELKVRSQRLLLMLDEFPALGRLDFFESSLAFMAGYGLKSFLIAQSLNQIEKAYGPNNAILDNCHVRVAFATNDERTARRVSDALGMATELRAMKNYAGHRLSPWLGHLMVSRQETARPLLTPGEVMQLPPTDELVLVSGIPPIRAHRARFYEDKELKSRVLRPPALALTQARVSSEAATPHADDWTTLPLRVARVDAAADPSTGFWADEDPANGGIRREPALPEHEAIAAEEPRPRQEFALLEDEPDDDALRVKRLYRSFRAAAQQAALDPADELGL
jgi:type IV secretion system protein VirD4